MKSRIWIYYLKNAFNNIFNNRLIHAISIGTIFISFLLFGSFMFLFVNLNNWIQGYKPSLSISVYLEDGLDDRARNEIGSKLLNLPGAEMKEYISKEKAMQTLKKGLAGQAGLLDGLSKNFLPASYEIIFRDSKNKRVDPNLITKKIEKLKGVDEVQYSEQLLERFEGILYVLEMGGIIIGCLLCLAVLFITINTIKLTIYARWEEIKIVKIVGATDWFVKMPFLIEGAIQGLFSCLTALLVLFSAYSLFSNKSFQVLGLPVLDIVFLPKEYIVFLILLGMGLGFLAGFIAVGRFLIYKTDF